MNFIETFRVAIEAILSNKMRSGLTMLGVIIGVMAVILLVSIGEGARLYITKELTGLGTNLLIITPGKTQTSGGFHPPSAGTVRKLTYDDAQALRRRAWLLTDAVRSSACETSSSIQAAMSPRAMWTASRRSWCSARR